MAATNVTNCVLGHRLTSGLEHSVLGVLLQSDLCLAFLVLVVRSAANFSAVNSR